MTGRATLELDDIQGNILHAYNLPCAAHLFVGIHEPESGRRLLQGLVGDVTTAAPWSQKPRLTHNVALTYAGLAAFELPSSLLTSFPAAFRDGMAKRAHVLRDDGPSAPASWDPGLGTGGAHVLVSLYGASPTDLATGVDALSARIRGDDGLDLVNEQHTAQLDGIREQFGFADGYGQPAIAGARDAPQDQPSWTRWGRRQPLGPGEILVGYPDSDGFLPPAPSPPFDRNGTYMVYRKLAQDVAGFRALTAAAASLLGSSADFAAAKLFGRWPDGTPLELSPQRPDPAISGDPSQINRFDYHDDPIGERCPLGAHIRRANPRDALGFAYTMSTRHRIIRRGMPYGPLLPPGQADDGVDRGLVFICFNVELERQFEFIQSQWCNDGNPFGLGVDCDPIVGGGGRKFTIQGAPPQFVAPLPALVTTRGGEYLFAPSVRALRTLADARPT